MLFPIELKKELAQKKVNGLVSEISKDVKSLRKLNTKKQLTPLWNREEKRKLNSYTERLEEKIDLALTAMTEEKFGKANLSQLSKTLRMLTDRATVAHGKVNQSHSVQERLNVNINLNNLSKDDLLDLLNKKSQEYNPDKK